MSALHLARLLFGLDGSIASKSESSFRDKDLVDPEESDDNDDDMHVGHTPTNIKPELEELYEKIE